MEHRIQLVFERTWLQVYLQRNADCVIRRSLYLDSDTNNRAFVHDPI